MSKRPLELCCRCDAATGRAGISEDSLYTESGKGPFCESCFDEAEEANTQNKLCDSRLLS